MKRQLKHMGYLLIGLEIGICDESYYHQQQKLFLQFYKEDLIYKESLNWDPVENTVLANEQVIDGKGWRSGLMLSKRNYQWF